ncbi:hypothetical protein [Globicatella sanguinis]|uniref:hypothetical protein n=1 Tax=Globicatella sanguinis TaxID=13076 RepID=UPI000C7A9AD8|nr:hypothetical protein [Globicatella sanguinis]MDK7631622.1 hypothetical protein [Globicatella sanguinis]WIK66857.1 hypothetical protein CYJ72_001870 [Globicatella sanguinis]WKT56262.1 hypothetical protein Q3C38_01870 [Globicatella sanguinis]
MEIFLLILIYFWFINTKSKEKKFDIVKKLEVDEEKLSEKTKNAIEAAERSMNQLKSSLKENQKRETKKNRKRKVLEELAIDSEMEQLSIEEDQSLMDELESDKNITLDNQSLNHESLDARDSKEKSIEDYLTKDIDYFESMADDLIEDEEDTLQVERTKHHQFKQHPYQRMLRSGKIKEVIVMSEIMKRPQGRKQLK